MLQLSFIPEIGIATRNLDWREVEFAVVRRRRNLGLVMCLITLNMLTIIGFRSGVASVNSDMSPDHH
jgi:hypothetical protein